MIGRPRGMAVRYTTSLYDVSRVFLLSFAQSICWLPVAAGTCDRNTAPGGLGVACWCRPDCAALRETKAVLRYNCNSSTLDRETGMQRRATCSSLRGKGKFKKMKTTKNHISFIVGGKKGPIGPGTELICLATEDDLQRRGEGTMKGPN
ncbi:hypothetical protein F4825DRAFT_423576 [Nemania diffusa]|nr:hypothetical protein F4825DRAFT_423576 [Nemania diffusa]